MATTTPARDAAPPELEPDTKKLRFPTAFTVLATVLVVVWIASFFVPAGAYKTDPETGAALDRRERHVVRLGGSFLVMIYGFIPWNDLGQEGWGRDFPLPTFASFSFPEPRRCSS
jgi:hypothetical protein